MKTLADRIAHLNPCGESLEWAAQYGADDASYEQAWQQCENGAWMLWWIGRQITSDPWSEDRKPLLACCLDCVETVKHLWTDQRISESVAVLRAWIAGEASVRKAKDARIVLHAAAAYAASYAAAKASYAAAKAAAYAAYASYADAYAAAQAAEAAAYAACASYADAYAAADAAAQAAEAADAKKKVLKQCAEIIRAKHYQRPPKIRSEA